MKSTPKLDRATQHVDCAVVVVGLAPATLAEDLHGAVPEAVDDEVTADRERPRTGDAVAHCCAHAPIQP